MALVHSQLLGLNDEVLEATILDVLWIPSVRILLAKNRKKIQKIHAPAIVLRPWEYPR